MVITGEPFIPPVSCPHQAPLPAGRPGSPALRLLPDPNGMSAEFRPGREPRPTLPNQAGRPTTSSRTWADPVPNSLSPSPNCRHPTT
eukprot:12508497-Heterocapsa_arctica.AAC.1